MNTEFEQMYNAFHEEIVWFDRSETGKIAVLGADRFSWLQGMVSNDVKILEQPRFYGELQACLLDSTGHIESDLRLVSIRSADTPELVAAVGASGQDFVLLDLPRENVGKVMALLDRYIIMEDVELRDISHLIGCLSAQGKDGKMIWEDAMEDMPKLPHTSSVFIMATHSIYLGMDEYAPLSHLYEVRQMMREGGVPEINVEMQELLRVEAGIPKWGAELDKSVIASEAVGATHISLTKGCYIGQEIIARIDARGHTNRALTGLIVTGETLPQAGDKLFATENGSEREVGRITSVVPYSPAAGGKPIALGFVRHEHRAVGTELRGQGTGGRGQGNTEGETRVVVAELPFAKRDAA